jgi:phosphatidylglycerophosphatase A
MGQAEPAARAARGGRRGTAFHVATCFGLGDRLPAPGTTAGSFPASLLWWLAITVVVSPQLRHAITVVGLAVFVVAGLWAAEVEERRRSRTDPGPVVIDEVAGQWLTYLLALPWLDLAGLRQQAVVVAAGFVLFRIFDVVKPWPVRRLERLGGGVGIMVDDLAAGLYAGVVLAVLSNWL